MQLRQWITFFSSPHSRLPQTPILFQQSLSLIELTDSKLRFGRSALIWFFPKYGEPGFSKSLPQRYLRFYPLAGRGVSALHNDQVQDKAPCDKTHSPGVDLPRNRRSSQANEKRVLTDPAHVKRLCRSPPLLLTCLYRPVVRQKPNHAPTSPRKLLFEALLSRRLLVSVCDRPRFGISSDATKLSVVLVLAVKGKEPIHSCEKQTP